jgi:POT family proton-dependent oligopeptide transporter
VNSSGATLAPGASSGRTFLGHPVGLATLFFVEMWERMSFYGMRALLILFLVDQVAHHGMGLDDRTAASIYGLYVGAAYIACLPGGWIGDRVLGAQRAVLFGGIVITLGHLLLGFAPSNNVFFFGLVIIVLGTGLLKTNASAIVAELYPEGGARRDAGFTIYYIGVNVGATIGPLITGWLALSYGWSAGFMAAAVGMTAGVVQYLWSRSALGEAGLRPTAHDSDTPVLGSALPSGARRWLMISAALLIALVVLFWTGIVHVPASTLEVISTRGVVVIAVLYFLYLLFGAGLRRAEQLRVLVVVVLFVASVLFWAGYEQTGSSLNLFAERSTDRHLWNFVVPAEWFQSLNPVYIIIFGSAFSALWIALARRNLDPSMGLKFIFGLVGVAAGFAVMAAASRLVVGGQRVGMGWLSATYLLHTWGELCLSPVGLSAVTKLVPARFCGQSLGIFFVSLSLGNLLAGRIAGDFDPSNLSAMPGQFMYIFWFCSLCAAAVAVLLPLMRRWAGGVT